MITPLKANRAITMGDGGSDTYSYKKSMGMLGKKQKIQNQKRPKGVSKKQWKRICMVLNDGGPSIPIKNYPKKRNKKKQRASAEVRAQRKRDRLQQQIVVENTSNESSDVNEVREPIPSKNRPEIKAILRKRYDEMKGEEELSQMREMGWNPDKE